MKANLSLITALIFLSGIIFSGLINAQTKTGNWFAEGNIGDLTLSNSNYQTSYGTSAVSGKAEYNNLGFSLYPRIGYFISDNLAAGATINFTYLDFRSKTYWDNGVTSTELTTTACGTGLNPFLRYYFTKNKKNRFYLQIGVAISKDLFNSGDYTSYDKKGVVSATDKTSSLQQGASGTGLAGFNHFFSDRVAFNAALGYSYGKVTENVSGSSTSSGVTSTSPVYKNNISVGNLQWNMGFTVFFSGKNEN